jgi:hypothetical protein
MTSMPLRWLLGLWRQGESLEVQQVVLPSTHPHPHHRPGVLQKVWQSPLLLVPLPMGHSQQQQRMQPQQRQQEQAQVRALLQANAQQELLVLMGMPLMLLLVEPRRQQFHQPPLLQQEQW